MTETRLHFADRLVEAIREKGNAVCVGLDPRVRDLPRGMLPVDHPPSVTDKAMAYEQFCCGVIDAVAPLVPAVKPQAAFFEQLGAPGCGALSEVMAYARNSGLQVILDGKRNDIGSTAEAYAHAYLGTPEQSLWGADALTVNPYLGDDSLEPFVKVAQQRACGLFVLVKTSNPGSKQFQDLLCEGRPVYRHVADYVAKLAEQTQGKQHYSCVGAVVGATHPEQLAELRSAMPNTWFLVPGYGSQGGAAADVKPAFDANGLGAIINNARGIIFAYQRKPYAQKYGPSRWQDAVQAATEQMIQELHA